MNIDISADAIGNDSKGNPVYLKDIWPSSDEVQASMSSIQAKMFNDRYDNVFEGDED